MSAHALPCRSRIYSKLSNPLGADSMHDASQLLDLPYKPDQILVANAIMLRVARLHVSFLQLLEECPLAACIRRPSLDQSSVEPLGLEASGADIMHMRTINSAKQRKPVVKTTDVRTTLEDD